MESSFRGLYDEKWIKRIYIYIEDENSNNNNNDDDDDDEKRKIKKYCTAVYFHWKLLCYVHRIWSSVRVSELYMQWTQTDENISM